MITFFNKLITSTVLLYCLLGFTTAAQAQVNAYTFNQSVETFTAITGSTVIAMVDDKLDTIATPTFNFNNEAMSSIVVSSNGFLVLGNTHTFTRLNYTPLSATLSAKGTIAAFARDLLPVDTASSKILYEVVGSEIVVQWTNVKRASTSTENLTFQIRIDTTTNIIKVVYGDMIINNGSTHPQVGLRGASSADFNNRKVVNAAGNSWAASIAGSVNSDICVARADATSINPQSGLTYEWTPATCFTPTDFINVGLSANSLDFSWNRSIAQGEIAMYISGGNMSTATFIPVSGTSVSIPNLSPDTRYGFHLREICAVGDSSNWSTMVSAKTACNPINTLPWSEDFEGILSGITSTSVGGALPNTCWSYRGDITGAQAVLSSSRRAKSGNKYLFTNYSTAFGTGDVVYTPAFELQKDSSYTFSFWYKAAGRTWDTVRAMVGNMPDVASMQVIGTPVYAINDSANYVRYFGEFVPSESGTYYFAANIFAGSLVDYFCLDDFKLEKTPTCPELHPATLSNVTATSVDVSWTSTNDVELLISLATETIAEGTIVPIPTNTNTYTISNLDISKGYKVYIRQICAVGDTSAWSAASNFQTSCSVLNTPWFEDFESVNMQMSTANPIPDCWARIGDFKGESTPQTYGRQGISGNNYLHTQYTTVAGTGDRIYTPSFNLEAGKTYTFGFKYTKPNAIGVFDSVKVAVANDQLGTNIEVLGQINALTGLVPVTEYTVEFTPTTTGIYNFAVSVFAATSPWFLVFDDFSLTQNCAIATIDFATTEACNSNDASIVATVLGATAPYTYAWSNGETTASIFNASVGIDYTVTVTDAQGCETISSVVTVTEAAHFAAAASSTNATCPTCTDGTVTLTVVSAIEPVSFAWSNGENTQNLAAVEAGIYIVTITNGNGCTKEITIEVQADTTVVGLNENAFANAITLYPNPTNNIITLEGFDVETKIFVINNLGQIVMEVITQNTQIQLDLSFLPAASYWVRMNNEKGSMVLPVIKAD